MDKRIFENYAGLEGRQLLEPILRDFHGRAAVVSSFGAESSVLLHMVAEVDPSTPIIFLDTGKHFWETLSYRSMLIDRLGLTGVRSIEPDLQDLAATDPDGLLHKSNTDLCCHIRKTIPCRRRWKASTSPFPAASAITVRHAPRSTSCRSPMAA
jgi:phosphoadenosine phosphosulfate reductase